MLLTQPLLMVAVVIAALACAASQTQAEQGKINTIAGTGKAADGGRGGTVLTTNIGNPFGVEIGPDGALYICEVSNHRVRRLDLKSGNLTTVAGNGRKGYSGDGGAAIEASLNEPYEVRFDPQGNMFFVEMQNHLVRRVDAKTGKISTVAGTGKAGYRGDGGPAIEAEFKQPHSIALDDRGGLYIADIGNHRIRRVDLTSGRVESIAGNGEKQLPKEGSRAQGNPILGPRALYYTDRTLWIALREGNSVWKLDLDGGTLHHVAGTGQKGFSGDGGAASNATFNGPKGIAVGPAPHDIFVVDTENQTIRKIERQTGIIRTIAGSGPQARGYGGDGGPATAASMNRPHGICVGSDGTVYIGDSENHRVRVISIQKPR
jgi:DNA-binding beta-propeller fold protein YncE